MAVHDLNVRPSRKLPVLMSVALVVSMLLSLVAGALAGVMDASAAAAQPLPASEQELDLTDDGQVSNVDIMAVVNAWTNARESGNACGGVAADIDVNGDGCVTIADVQIVSARVGRPVQGAMQSESAGRSLLSTGSTAALAQTTGATLTVNGPGDGVDINPGDGLCETATGRCTLRAAIEEANQLQGPNTIAFNISGTGPHSINIATELPTISDSSGATTIDGYTQPGASPNSDSLISNAVIAIQVVGPRTTGNYDSINGITITSPNNVIRGLSFSRLKRNIWISGASADNNIITGNFIGLTADGRPWYDDIARVENRGGDNSAFGLWISYSAKGNRIGGTAPADRNVISGNANDGLGTRNEGTSQNIIIGNIVGLGPNGTTRVRNWGDGLDFNYSASDNQVGGTNAGERNVISGNAGEGIELSHDPTTARNVIAGNYIGTDVTGNGGSTTIHRNSGFGISMEDGPADNQIGPGNVISNNAKGGLHIYGANNARNRIFENRIGVGLNGAALGNVGPGIRIRYNATSQMVGPNNIIANNTMDGVELVDANNDFNTITRNSMYSNGDLGIDIEPNGVNQNDQYSRTGANERLNFPVVTIANIGSVSGTACGGCTVEVFIADGGAGAYGEGKTFLASGTAAGDGSFAIAFTGVNAGDWITTTATDSTGNTSEFSSNVQIASGGGPPPPSGIALPGKIEVEDYNLGGPDVAYYDTTTGNAGNWYRKDNVDIGRCADPTTPAGNTCYNAGWIDSGEWLAYDVNVTEAGFYTFTVRATTPSNGRRMYIKVDGTNVTGTIAIPNTGGWNAYRDVTTQPIQLTAGNRELRLFFENANFNVNYVVVTKLQTQVNVAPEVTIVAPSAGAELTGVVDIQVAATDDLDAPDALAVDVSVGGDWMPATFDPVSQEYALQFDTSTVANGQYEITARGTDSFGETGTSAPVSVTVNNAPEPPPSVAVPATIQVEDYIEGGQGVGYNDTTAGNSGGRYRSDDVDIQLCSDPDWPTGEPCYNVGWTAPGEWLAYAVSVESAGEYRFVARVATPLRGRAVYFTVNGVNVTGSLAIPRTGGYQVWTTIRSAPVQLGAGVQEVRLNLEGDGMNLNWFAIETP